MLDGLQTLNFAWAAALVLLLPGISLLLWLPARSDGERAARRDPLCWLADAAALSIAIDALVGMIFLLFRIRVGGLALAGLYGISLVLALVAILWRGAVFAHRRSLLAKGLGAVAVVGALAGWRLWQARGLALPAWVDSVHHAFLVRKIGSVGGLPLDLLPEINAPLSYHFGFHLAAALFAAWARSGPVEGMLWFGQIVNALVALSVYRAAAALQPEQTGPLPRWAAPLFAALLTGFVFQMPAYYVTWGRYTLLAGLLLLGPAMAAAQELANNGGSGAGLRLALLLAGLCLTHYFVVLLAGLFIGLLALPVLFRLVRSRQGLPVLLRLGLWSLVGLLLALPWLARVVAANTAFVAVQVVNPLTQAEAARQSTLDYLRYIGYLTGPRHSHLALGMAGVGLLAMLRKPALRLFAGWALILGLMTVPWGLRLLFFRPDYFAIILFFPASIVLGNLLASGAAACGVVARRRVVAYVVGLLVAALFLAWGVRATANVINPVTVIGTPEDLRALQWIDANVAPNARFLITPTFWQGRVYRGVDGGYWILPYTGRESILPPVLYDMASIETIQQINSRAERVTKLTGCTEDFWALIQEAGLTHIYMRSGVNAYQPAVLEGCAGLRTVYAADGVVIYEVIPR